MQDNAKIPTLVDNLGDNTVLNALRQLLPFAQALDVATGTFEIGSLLALDGLWQPLQKVRVLMGDETTRRTRQELIEALKVQSEASIEAVKEHNDTEALVGLEAIRAALVASTLVARIYTRAKFHAKAYYLPTKNQPIDYALLGSSNFTEPGLTRNMELNLFTTDKTQIENLKAWYQKAWEEADVVNNELIKVIERHLRVFTPFEIWAKALYEYFNGREAPLTDWERTKSLMFPVLSKYQQDGYRQAREIANKWKGAFVCDGVGLGKTFIGLMLLEYHLSRGEQILLVVPKSAEKSVWLRNIDRYIRPHYQRALRQHLEIRRHTDFGRPGTISKQDLDYYGKYCDVVMIDEAHHFRTPHANRSKLLMSLLDVAAQNGDAPKEKRCYFLTATPINNSLLDLYHLINYVSRNRQDYFASLGVHNLRRYFSEEERRLEEEIIGAQRELFPDVQAASEEADLLRSDQLFKNLVIQRSRAYVQDAEKAEAQAGAGLLLFPERQRPQVIDYSLKKVYSGLYTRLSAAFDKKDPLVTLAVYNREKFRRGAQDPKLANRDRQVIGLIRTLMLKRLESSYKAFEASLEDLLRKMAQFVRLQNEERWLAWKADHQEAWQIIEQHWNDRHEADEKDPDDEEENDFEANEFDIQPLNPDEYKVEQMLPVILEDMALLVKLLSGVYNNLSPETDDKLQKLVKALREDEQLRDSKVVIFTEFKDTARYLWRQLQSHGFSNVDELDSTREANREQVIKRFAPFYNCSPEELPQFVEKQIRVLVSTDVLSEGLNLQDSSLIVNYDLHWNPVRLMQRIGRVDRRLDLEIEMAMGRDGSQPLKVYVYNFLPPDELEELLRLFQRVTGKLLRISKTLGIESPVLTPDEEFNALRLFNERYLKTKSTDEELKEELDKMREEHPALFDELTNFPNRGFSGKRAETATKGLFCAYRFPSLKPEAQGEMRWYFRVANTGEVLDATRLDEIAKAIRALPDDKRALAASADDLKAWRKEIEQQRVRPHLRDLNAPQGENAKLICWMEIC